MTTFFAQFILIIEAKSQEYEQFCNKTNLKHKENQK